MGQTIGVKEIAKKANVSIGTVDRVLHNRNGVSEATKKKIAEIIKKYNYEPNILARRLASRKVLKFATLIPAVSEETDYWQFPLNGIVKAETELKDFGISIKKYFFDLSDKSTFTEQTNKILKSKVDGILISPVFAEDTKSFAEACKKKKIPVVFINSDIPGSTNLCYVGPDLYKSGYLSAHLANFIINEHEKILVLNISKAADSMYYIQRKEDGFRSYFTQRKKDVEVVSLNIRKTEYNSIKKELISVFEKHKIKLVFVTNSRVFYVARFLEEQGIEDISLIGFDFIEKNLAYLEKETIDFLICQKPAEQAYQGVMALYNHLVRKEDVEKNHYMSIDIITKENYKLYRN